MLWNDAHSQRGVYLKNLLACQRRYLSIEPLHSVSCIDNCQKTNDFTVFIHCLNLDRTTTIFGIVAVPSGNSVFPSYQLAIIVVVAFFVSMNIHRANKVNIFKFPSPLESFTFNLYLLRFLLKFVIVKMHLMRKDTYLIIKYIASPSNFCFISLLVY